MGVGEDVLDEEVRPAAVLYQQRQSHSQYDYYYYFISVFARLALVSMVTHVNEAADVSLLAGVENINVVCLRRSLQTPRLVRLRLGTVQTVDRTGCRRDNPLLRLRLVT